MLDPELGIVLCDDLGEALERIDCLILVPHVSGNDPVVPTVLEVDDVAAEQDRARPSLTESESRDLLR